MIDRLSRAGAGRPHVLLVAAVDATAERLAVEAEIGARTWPTATSPADTDILAVAGEPGAELAEVIAQVWARIPAPRARIAVPGPRPVAACIDAAVEQLVDRAHQRRNAPDGQPPRGEDHDGGMALPEGLPMADLGDDRDGLMLDRLHVPLGPVLPDWPHGLVLDAVLQGDVVQEARLRVLDPATLSDASFWGPPGRREPRREVARRLDGLARFLGVAGWPAAASAARNLRDETLAGASRAGIRTQVDVLGGRVRRSRTLRRMLRGLRAGDVEVGALLSGNLAALDAAAAALAWNGVTPSAPDGDRPDGPADQLLSRLESRLVGAELAAARLIVAAVDPDLDTVPASRREPVHPDGHADD